MTPASNRSVSITGLSILSGLGNTPDEHEAVMAKGLTGLKPLCELLGDGVKSGDILGGWIEPRELLISRKWAPASTLALHCAKEAVADAGLSGSDLKHAAVIAGSSRGNAYLTDWKGRRPFKLMAASNSMHGEIASAVSIGLGITGPWQTIASGCAASLDALGYAYMMLNAGIVKHAIVLGVELPLVPEIIQHYLNTGVLTTNGVNDPYHPDTSGFFPAEAGTALVLSAEDVPDTPKMLGYWCNSDADSPIGMPDDGHGLRDCIKMAKDALTDHPRITAVCPHASGTALHAKAEQTALLEALEPEHDISLHPLKPFTGHTVGASGALDTAILAHYLRKRKLPHNLPNLSSPNAPFSVPSESLPFEDATLLKIAVGMGGHNSVIAMR